jgi:hypothetical protein
MTRATATKFDSGNSPAPTSANPTLARRPNDKLERNLSAYAAAATAACAGLLAMSQPAEATIVYTPTNQKITQTTFLDLNNDGINDFAFHAFCTYSHPGSSGTFSYAQLNIRPVQVGNRIWGQVPDAAALAAGVSGGSKGPFKTDIYLMGLDQSNGYFGQWAPRKGSVKNRYVGLKFVISGQVHFGWARLNVQIRSARSTCVQAVLTGYAYETVAGMPIVTGKTSGTEVASAGPATLGQLALGAAGLVLWRKESERVAPVAA